MTKNKKLMQRLDPFVKYVFVNKRGRSATID